MILQKAELVAALVDAFTLPTFDQMLEVRLNRRRDQIVIANGLSSLEDIVTTVVLRAERDRWAGDLIRAALEANSENPKLKDFVSKNKDWDPAVHLMGQPPNYYQALFMRGRRVFLKRDEFRRLLQEIGVSGNSRVMAVDGDRLTGKTYSRDFLHYIREVESDSKGVRHEIIFVCLDDCVFEPEQLAMVLGTRLGLKVDTLPPDLGEQAPRRIPALVEWLGKGIQAEGADLRWLILDGFRVQVQPKATHDLIRALIDSTDREWDRARLVLLNYAKFLDIDVSTYILSEEIRPIKREDIEDFFRDVYRLSGKTWDETTIETTVKSVLTQLDAEVAKRGSEFRMKIQSAVLATAAKKLLG